jgi:hypothetical protein
VVELLAASYSCKSVGFNSIPWCLKSENKAGLSWELPVLPLWKRQQSTRGQKASNENYSETSRVDFTKQANLAYLLIA